MAVTNYHTVNGEIIGETTVGSPRVDYLTDALGSVTATVNQGAQVVNTYRYNPFGSLLAKTGTGPDPAFGWGGELGYKPSGNAFSNFYIMLRHQDELNGRWATKDRGRFASGPWKQYVFALNNPVRFTDPTGMNVPQRRTSLVNPRTPPGTPCTFPYTCDPPSKCTLDPCRPG